MDDPDLLVIGGGAGGISGAQAAARRGATVLLVQDGPIGGDCTFTGCVPSKALLAAAASGAGFVEAMARVRGAVTTTAGNEDGDAMAAQAIPVRHARARFKAPGVVDVDGTPVRARRTIVATGAGPVLPPTPGLDTLEVLTNETLFQLDHVRLHRRRWQGRRFRGWPGPEGADQAHERTRRGLRCSTARSRWRSRRGWQPR